MKMRFRKDGWHYADLKARGMTFEQYFSWEDSASVREQYKKEWDAVPKAEPGDVWRIHWSHHEPPSGPQIDDWLAGYAICCIGCGRVHDWMSANNCSQKIQSSYKDSSTGLDVPYTTCVHQRDHTSCWAWTGSAEEGTLTGAP